MLILRKTSNAVWLKVSMAIYFDDRQIWSEPVDMVPRSHTISAMAWSMVTAGCVVGYETVIEQERAMG